MAEDRYIFDRVSSNRIKEFVLRNERRPTNGVQHWRANKYVLGAPSQIRWGLSKPMFDPNDPLTAGVLRIENGPSDDIGYSDADGVFAHVSIPFVVVPDTWYPIRKEDGPIYFLLVFDVWMQGVFGPISGYDSSDPRPAAATLTIDGGSADGLAVPVIEPGIHNQLPRMANDRPAFAVRLNSSVTFGAVISQPCEDEG